MKCHLVIHTRQCLARFDARYEKAQKFLDSEVLRDSAPYVPMRTGYLMKSGSTGTVIGSGEVKYNAPYAKCMYYAPSGTHFSRAKHPQACAQWFEKAKAIKKPAWVAGVNKIIKG